MKNRTVRTALLTALAAAALAAPGVRASTVTCKVELDRAILPADSVTRAVIKVTLDVPRPESSKNRPPINVALVLDRSGSMSGDKIRRAREAAIEALNRLDARDLISVVAYNHTVETIVTSEPADRTDAIASRISRIEASGNTALFGGVSQGAAEIRRHLDDRHVPRIILLSDGLANVGPSSPDDLGRLGAALMKEGIAVSTVGLGTDYNEDLMTRLSQNSDGNAYFASASEDLARIFASELGSVLNVAARDVTVEITCPGDVRPLRIIGRDGRIDGRTVSLKLNQLYGGQQKFALIEVEIQPVPANETRLLATASISYEGAIDQSRGSATAKVSAQFSRKDEEVQQSANRIVIKEVMLNESALAKDRAVQLADQGKRNEAAAELKKQGQVMRAKAKQYKMEELAPAAVQLEQQAGDIEEKGLDKTGRKSMITDSYQIRNQQ
jgi:Ca-activated chloride channel family protein